jgi:hypothetical protein
LSHKNHLRCVKVREIFYSKDGDIQLTPEWVGDIVVCLNKYL